MRKEAFARLSKAAKDKHRAKAREARRFYRARHPEKCKNKADQDHLPRRYRITRERYAEMLAEQGGVCAICRGGNSPHYAANKKYPFQVDHCHETDRVRRLLCNHCNMGLGQFRDNPELLELAAAYLRLYR